MLIQGHDVVFAVEARKKAAIAGRRAGLTPMKVQDLELCVGEAVTNALTHGGGEVEVNIDERPYAVHVTVTDSGAGFPIHQTITERLKACGGGQRTTSGRGLYLIAQLAQYLGVQRIDGSTITMFEVTLSEWSYTHPWRFSVRPTTSGVWVEKQAAIVPAAEVANA